MRPYSLACLAAAAAVIAIPSAKTGASADFVTITVQRAGRVCPDPARPCPGFRAHDLSFVLRDDGVARAEQRSDAFYAVILRSGPRCSISERQRVAAQALLPGRKVFSGRFECDEDEDGENNVSYTGVNPALAFLAVHAGANRQQASAALAAVARTGRFPGANLRRMQAVYTYP